MLNQYYREDKFKCLALLLLFIHGKSLLPLFVGFFCVWYLFCYAVLCVLSSFAIIQLGKRELVAFLMLSSGCHVAVIFLCLVLTVSWVGL